MSGPTANITLARHPNRLIVTFSTSSLMAAVDQTAKKITIKHGAIPTLDMEQGRTMVFSTPDSNLQGSSPSRTLSIGSLFADPARAHVGSLRFMSCKLPREALMLKMRIIAGVEVAEILMLATGILLVAASVFAI